MNYKFVGSDCEFNNRLKQSINIPHDYTVISNIDGDYSIDYEDKKTIVLLPISSEEEYFSSVTKGSLKSKKTFFDNTNICTLIYIFMPQYVDVDEVSNIINTFDKESLVDCMWIYPKIEQKLQMRNNEIHLLPYQQELKISYYLTLRDKKFINESLLHYSVLLNNDKHNMVVTDTKKVIPYYSIREGVTFTIKLIEHIREMGNIRIYKNREVVFEKIITENSVVDTWYDDGVFDLYDIQEYNYIQTIKNEYEDNRPIYLFNTETVELKNDTDVFVGLASGNIVAKLAFEHKIQRVIMFDYSQRSLDFQRELILSGNRLGTYKKHLPNLILGIDKATASDLDRVDKDIDLYYDYLKTIDVEFLNIDLRNHSDIIKLFDNIPANSTLWISNVLSYITTIDTDCVEIYNLIDKLCIEKNVTLLPNTRVYYEG